MRADFLDRYARGDTWCHRLPPRGKLWAVLAFLLVVMATPLSHWPLLGLAGCLVAAGLTLAEIPRQYVVQRVAWLLPAVLGLALAGPLSRGPSEGWQLALLISLRSVLSFLAGLWLVNTTPFDPLLQSLAEIGLPQRFVELLAFMYRYCFVVFDELVRMRTAQRARTVSPPSLWQAWRDATNLLGMLLIRSLNRAERIHGAMCSRGWAGRLPKNQS
jgi:cobalt/nickel transport system permease protein